MQFYRAFPLKSGNASTGGGSGSGSGGGRQGGDFPVSSSPSRINKYAPVPGAIATSVSVTATPAAPGVAPYTYAWTSDNTDITPNTPTTAACTFSCTGTGASSTSYGTMRCTVTDTNGLVGWVDVDAFFQIGGASL